MKTFSILCFTLFAITATGFAQEDDNTDVYFGKHEIKGNGLMLILGAIEPSYEYILNEESSIGASVFLPISGNGDLETDINYYISPYYRHFFGKKYAAGFFVEGFAMLNSIEQERVDYFIDDNDPNFNSEDKDYTDLALGIGLGGKWITKRGFIFELNAGIGRNLFNVDASDIPIVGKVGFNLGYRF